MPVQRISKEDLKQQLESTEPAALPVLLDVRLKYPYEHSALRLPGARRLPPDTTAFPDLPRDRLIVAYDSDPDEIVSGSVVAVLLRLGYQAAALKGGIGEWIAANYPVEPKEAPAAPAAGAR